MANITNDESWRMLPPNDSCRNDAWSDRWANKLFLPARITKMIENHFDGRFNFSNQSAFQIFKTLQSIGGRQQTSIIRRQLIPDAMSALKEFRRLISAGTNEKVAADCVNFPFARCVIGTGTPRLAMKWRSSRVTTRGGCYLPMRRIVMTRGIDDGRIRDSTALRSSNCSKTH